MANRARAVVLHRGVEKTVCGECARLLPLDDFRTRKDGYRAGDCKSCERDVAKAKRGPARPPMYSWTITGYAICAEEDLPGSEPVILQKFQTLEAAQHWLKGKRLETPEPEGCFYRIRSTRHGLLDEVCFEAGSQEQPEYAW